LALDAAQAKLDVATRELERLKAWKRDEEVSQLEAQAREADARLRQAQLQLDRYRQLERSGTKAASASERDAAQAEYETALAAEQGAKAALELARAGPTPEEIQVAQAQVKLAQSDVALKQDQLDKCKIYCPYDAVIVDRYVGVGDRVTAMPRVEIMQIIDPSLLLAQVNVPEKYHRLVKVNDLAQVEARGLSQPVPGLVALVNDKIDPETRTFRVRVGVENPKPAPDAPSSERRFKAGSYVRVTLSLRTATDALIVPSGAVTFDKGQPAVFVFHGDKVEKRLVELGIASETEYEVTNGVSEGEKVVEGGTALLADGLPVRLRGSQASPDGPRQSATSTVERRLERRVAGLSLASEPVGAHR
jgi:multidrug efflux pump subunit AcrA (membrane-fusion protein)